MIHDREALELEGMVRRTLRSLVRRAGEGDTTALEALARLERVASSATTVALSRAHTSGGGFYSWGELADVTGSTRQAVQQRAARMETHGPLIRWLLQS
jgi:hypothetical protein